MGWGVVDSGYWYGGGEVKWGREGEMDGKVGGGMEKMFEKCGEFLGEGEKGVVVLDEKLGGWEEVKDGLLGGDERGVVDGLEEGEFREEEKDVCNG